jgi:predicted CXXCH cytochrome family protein
VKATVLLTVLLALPLAAQTYAGSAACKPCHAALYDRWSKTRMANVVKDPSLHPDAILPDLSKPDPLVTFTGADIAFTYGSKWKQRYFKRVGDDYFPLPAQWDVTHKVWRAYQVKSGTDWWTPFYPAENSGRPTGPLCDGCHSVNYNIATKTVTEWNVGCERCHGPGAAHAAHPTVANIVNPARLNSIDANDTCIQCHSQGRPLKNPIEGKYYDWPVGFQMGLKLKDFWQLEEHKLGETTFTHFADDTAHKNRMQGNDFVQSEMYLHGITCFGCHDVHGTSNNADLRKPANAMCLTCHTVAESHSHHRADSPGSLCMNCHMPKIEQTIADVNVRSHTFKFISPKQSAVPNPCGICHADKPANWAAETMATWPNHSPWR